MTHASRNICIVVTLSTIIATACSRPGTTSEPPGRPAVPVSSSASWDTLAPERDRFMAEVLKTIAGREMMPAESVFKNIQMPALKPMRSGQLVRAMNLGFARSLGVSCTHCHDTNDWASDAKRPKAVARLMIRMTNQLTQQIRALEGVNQTATVTCTTCHRGSVKPATSLPDR
jgi:hypothetical protein